MGTLRQTSRTHFCAQAGVFSSADGRGGRPGLAQRAHVARAALLVREYGQRLHAAAVGMALVSSHPAGIPTTLHVECRGQVSADCLLAGGPGHSLRSGRGAGMARTRAGRAAGGSARAAAPPGGPASCAPRRPRRASLSETPAAAIVLCHAALLIAPEFTHRVCTQRYAHAWMSDISPMTTEIPQSHSRITLRKRKTKNSQSWTLHKKSRTNAKRAVQAVRGRGRGCRDAPPSSSPCPPWPPARACANEPETANALVSRSARPVLTHPLSLSLM